jgi:signal transduction histidine kinase
VDQVLDLAAHDKGVSSFRPVPGDLGAVAREAAALVEPEARAAGVPVSVEVEDGLPAASFDPTLVRQIVVNLLDNAVKYSARSERKDVRLLVRRVPEGVALVVADRGPGVPAADRKRVFEPFFRSGREDTRSARGVGLGLALVRRYAEAHRARLVLESAEGQGTTVTVTFPV